MLTQAQTVIHPHVYMCMYSIYTIHAKSSNNYIYKFYGKKADSFDW